MIIIGCGGHARSVADVLLSGDNNPELLFVDESARPGETIFNYPTTKTRPVNTQRVHVAIGDNNERERWGRKLKSIETIVAKTAYLGECADIGAGVFIAHHAFIGPLTRIGALTIINTASVVEHEVRIGKCCHVAPNATICGRSVIGDRVLIGANTTVIDQVQIASDVIIGANTTVIDHITESGTYVGNPAEKKK